MAYQPKYVFEKQFIEIDYYYAAIKISLPFGRAILFTLKFMNLILS